MADTRRYAVETEFFLIDHASRALDKLGFSSGVLNKTLGMGLLKAQESWKALGQRVVQGAAALGGVAVASAVTATKKYIEFEDVLTKAGSKFIDMDVTSTTYADDLKMLSKAAQKVGAVTKYSASDAMGALDKMAMAGLSSKQSMAMLMGTTNLATAAGLDLTSAVDMATDSLGMFNLMKDKAGNPLDEAGIEKSMNRIADVVAKSTNMANMDMNMWFEAAKQGASAFTSFGGTVEEFSAITGILANSGVKGSAGGTAIRNIMLGLSGTTEPARKAIAALGIDVYDSQGKMRPFADLIEQLSKGLSGLGDEAKADYLSSLFGKENISSALLLVQEGADKIREYTAALEEAGGVSESIARAQEKSLSGQFAALSSAIEAKQLQFGEALANSGGLSVLQKFISIIQGFDFAPMVSVFSAAFEKVGEIVLTTVEYLKEYTDVGNAMNFGSIVQTIERIDIIPIVRGLGEAIEKIRNFFALLVEHHDLVIMIAKAWLGMKVAMMGLAPAVQVVQTFAPALNGIAQGAGIAVNNLRGMSEAATAAANAASPLGKVFGKAFTGIGSVAGKAGGAIATAFKTVASVLVTATAAAWGFIAPILANPLTWIVLAIVAAVALLAFGIYELVKHWDEVSAAVVRFATAVKERFIAVWEKAKTIAIAAFTTIRDWFSSAWESIKTTAITVFTEVRDWFTSIWEALKIVTTAAIIVITEFFSTAWENTKNVVSVIFSAIGNFFVSVWETAKSAVFAVWNGITSFIQGKIDLVKNAISLIGTVWNNLTSIFQSGGFIGVLKSIGSTIASFWLTPIEKMLSLLSNLPLVGDKFKGMQSAVSGIRSNLISGSVLNAPPTRTDAEASRYSESVNTSRVELTLPQGVNASATGIVAPGVTVNRKAS